jgi:hypothetical protein
MEKATGTLSRKRKTSKINPMIPILTGSMTEYLIQGFKDFYQESQTDGDATEGNEISEGVKR